MLLGIITPNPAYIFYVMQSYNDFIPITLNITFGIDNIAATLQKICRPKLLHVNFYSPARFLYITPTDLQILIFCSYKVLSNNGI